MNSLLLPIAGEDILKEYFLCPWRWLDPENKRTDETSMNIKLLIIENTKSVYEKQNVLQMIFARPTWVIK